MSLTDVIVVEGILVLCNEELRKLADYKVFIDASPETRLFRRIQRDVEERGRCIDSVKKQYKKFVIPSYEKYIEPSKKYADMIIPNNDDNQFIGVTMLCDLIKYKIANS